MLGCAKWLLVSSVSLIAWTGGTPSFEDLRTLDQTSVPVAADDFEALKLKQDWRCTARSRLTKPPVTDLYLMRFDRGDGNLLGRHLQSGVRSPYEVRDGELRRVIERSTLDTRNRVPSAYQLSQCGTCDVTLLPHEETVRFVNDKKQLLIRIDFNPALGAEPPQAYLYCSID